MIEVYTDGAANDKVDACGAGIYIKANGNHYAYSVPLGKLSNHEAEFHAVIHALDLCIEHFPGEILSFRSDSQVVVDVIEKDFTKNAIFLPLLKEIRDKTAQFPYFFIKWIPERMNGNADKLAKQALYRE